ncbi:MAG: hypothetical protein ABIU11_07405 [Chitinophagaceae bacterium]
MNKKILELLFLLFLFSDIKSQDTILTIKKDKILSKILEVSDTKISYKKYSNLEGPLYSIKKTEVLFVIYRNGEKEVFNVEDKAMIKDETINVEEQIKKGSLISLLAKKGNNVFVDGSDKSVVIHGKRALRAWGYWSIVEDKTKSDFILYINIRHAGLGDSFGSAQFINPANEKIIKTTEEVNTLMSMGFNAKKAAVEKVIRKKIKPLFE